MCIAPVNKYCREYVQSANDKSKGGRFRGLTPSVYDGEQHTWHHWGCCLSLWCDPDQLCSNPILRKGAIIGDATKSKHVWRRKKVAHTCHKGCCLAAHCCSTMLSPLTITEIIWLGGWETNYYHIFGRRTKNQDGGGVLLKWDEKQAVVLPWRPAETIGKGWKQVDQERGTSIKEREESQ